MLDKPYKLKPRNGIFYMYWTSAGARRDSQTNSASTKMRTLGEARLEAERIWRDMSDAVALGDKPTIRAVCDGYLRAIDERGKTSAQSFMLVPVKTILGDLPACDLKPADITRYKDGRRAMCAGIKPASLRRELSALTSALNWAERTELLTSSENRAKIIEKPPAGAPRTVTLNLDEAKELWGLALKDSADKPLAPFTRFVLVTMATAARRQAVLDLTWGQVDWAAEMIDFNPPGRVENNKRRAKVPISPDLMPYLVRGYSEDLASSRAPHARASRDARVMTRASCAREKPSKTAEFLVSVKVVGCSSVRAQWDSFIKNSKTPHLHVHDLRRTWATLAVQAGTDLFQVAKILGDDYRTVEKHYAHLRPGFLRDAIKSVNFSAG